jgi:hypothetical protein
LSTWIITSANIKYLFSLGRILSYVNFGPGYYIPKTGNSEFGANFGFDYNFNSSIVIELGADYHKIFREDIQFIHSQGGIIFRFSNL